MFEVLCSLDQLWSSLLALSTTPAPEVLLLLLLPTSASLKVEEELSLLWPPSRSAFFLTTTLAAFSFGRCWLGRASSSESLQII